MKRLIPFVVISLTFLAGPAVADQVVTDQATVADHYPVDPAPADGQLHVTVTAGQQTDHVFVRLSRPDVSSLVMAVSAATGTPSLQACPLTQPYPSAVDPANPPAYDCTRWAVPGVLEASSWTFALEGRHATGLAIVARSPIVPDTWQVALDPAKTVASVAPPVSLPSIGAQTEPPSAPALSSAPAARVGVLPAPMPAGPSAPSPAVAAPAPGPAQLSVTPASAATRERVPVWAWVLLVVLGALAVGLAVALFQARRGTPEVSTLLAWRTLRESPALTAATSVLLVAAFIGSGFVGGTGNPTETALGQEPGSSSPQAPGNLEPGAPGSPTTAPSTGATLGPTTRGVAPGPGQAVPTGAPTTNSRPSCRWYCDIAYQGNGTTPYGPAPKPRTGNGGATAVGVTADTIRVGVIGTGSSANFNGADATQGLKAYINKINQVEGGIYGRKIVLDYYSTNNDTPEGGVGAARQVIANDFAAVIINGIDGSDAAGQVLSKAGVPFINGQSSQPALANQPSVFTVLSTIEEHARGLVGFMAGRLHVGSKICFFVTNTNLWRSAVVPALKSEAKKRGVTIPVIAETETTQTSFTAQLKQMQDAGCTGVGMFTVLEEVGIVRDAKTLNYHPTFSGDEWTVDVLVQGQYGQSSLFSGMKVLRLIGTADEPGFRDYEHDSRTYTGGNALPDAAVHYAIAQVAVEGLKRAGPRLIHRTLTEGLFTLRAFSTKGILDVITYTPADRTGSHTVYTAQCCGTAADGTSRWVKLDGWRRFDAF